ncbi:hypothetical protein DFJ58DRAFT_842918 [Suillus subalutaceus]|uniref:uncharacterized protein n=1 Tax=Suillus subalutaceus TaxID=48586 RepID=UPI001B867827|nr:uncharacterized protein DFJ58DRAFT_842918 [Suillus subalutaceus]KAG1848540.1 hypothetical protein DFJ58DRAFT_842918 [Suillus subalutaceus]
MPFKRMLAKAPMLQKNCSSTLYRGCAVVNLWIPSPATADAADAQVSHGLGIYDEFATYGTNTNLSSYGEPLTDFIDNLHTFQTLQARIQRSRSQTPVAHSGRTHPSSSLLTFPSLVLPTLPNMIHGIHGLGKRLLAIYRLAWYWRH